MATDRSVSAEASTGHDPAPPDKRGTSAELGAGRESVVLRSSSEASTGRDPAPPDQTGTAADLDASGESVVRGSTDEERVRRIEDLVRRLAQIPDSEHRQIGEQLLQAVLELHGAALEKIMELVFESGPAGETLARRFAGDSLVSSLLVLHGLHPDDLETRARQVIAKVPGHAELISVFDGVVRVRISGGGCGSEENDQEALNAILRQALPDAADIVILQRTGINGFVPLVALNGAASRIG